MLEVTLMKLKRLDSLSIKLLRI